ncbi:hypothetical protein CMV_014647 [Castanea mollissima]|uniref:Uncharacterized protein n=1 Tax=Castanea mollissima TaxID=60419 RepID=A0A8J4QX13_9ROSI|nr:hypothetical protein CMV_014647 [Castanea mollissima]
MEEFNQTIAQTGESPCHYGLNGVSGDALRRLGQLTYLQKTTLMFCLYFDWLLNREDFHRWKYCQYRIRRRLWSKEDVHCLHSMYEETSLQLFKKRDFARTAVFCSNWGFQMGEINVSSSADLVKFKVAPPAEVQSGRVTVRGILTICNSLRNLDYILTVRNLDH